MSLRRIRYQVAARLDGYIAGPNGEFDWIIMDPDIDFAALFNQFDTFLMGRGTFEYMLRQQASAATPGMKTLVFSRTLRQQDHPDVTIVAEGVEKTLIALRKAPGDRAPRRKWFHPAARPTRPWTVATGRSGCQPTASNAFRLEGVSVV